MSRARRTLACALACFWALVLGGCASPDKAAGSAASTPAQIGTATVAGDPADAPRRAGARTLDTESGAGPVRLARSVERTTAADYEALAGLVAANAPPPAAPPPAAPPPAAGAAPARFAPAPSAPPLEPLALAEEDKVFPQKPEPEPEPEPELAQAEGGAAGEAEGKWGNGPQGHPVAAAKAKERRQLQLGSGSRFAIQFEEEAEREKDEAGDEVDGEVNDEENDEVDDDVAGGEEVTRTRGVGRRALNQGGDGFAEKNRKQSTVPRNVRAGRDDWAAAPVGGHGTQALGFLDDAEDAGRFESNLFDQSNFEAQVFEQEVVSRPESFLPRTCYVTNTYLGNRAGHLAALAALDAQLGPGDRPYARLGLPPQPFDGPESTGIALTAQLDRTWMEAPGRVFLQVGLRGSDRHGWRRPPIDLVLVLDPAVAAREDRLVALTTGLLRRLGPQDRLGVLVARPGSPEVLSAVDTVRVVRPRLSQVLGNAGAAEAAAYTAAERGDGAALGLGLAEAGSLLDAAAEGQARVPGTQVVLLAVDGGLERAEAARLAAHQLTLQGAVVSVAALDGAADWWPVADAGHGNLHRGPEVEHHLEAELDGLSRVVARLLRLDIRLAPGTHAVRVLGAEVLGAREVARVKAREEAVDARLAKTTGLKADRGEDGEGIQIVVPWFAGGDSHVVLVELWVDEPGPVAEVSLKYKDMVALNNGTARVGVALARAPRPASAAQAGVRRNVVGFRLAEALRAAGLAATQESALAARTVLRQALPREPADRAAVLAFLDLLERRPATLVAEALLVAADRRLGTPAAPGPRGGDASPLGASDRPRRPPTSAGSGRITF